MGFRLRPVASPDFLGGMGLNSKKTCRGCGRAKPAALFPHHHPLCATCHAARRRNLGCRSSPRGRGLKRCAQCAEEMPLKMFHWLRASGTHHSYCRACHAAYMAERYRRLRRGRDER